MVKGLERAMAISIMKRTQRRIARLWALSQRNDGKSYRWYECEVACF